MISDLQLERLLTQAMPGARIAAAELLGERTVRLDLRTGRPLVLRLAGPEDVGAGDPLAAEALALQALQAEIDLPLPAVLASDFEGVNGRPYLLTSYLEGMTLNEALPAMLEEQRYGIGRELGSLIARVHSYSCAAYGALDAKHPPVIGSEQAGWVADDADVRYMRARSETALQIAIAEHEIDQDGAERLAAWVATNLVGSGRAPCLVHGDLRPAGILVQRRERGWRLAGLVGWGCAMAWRPAWDHAAISEQFAGEVYFSLRVGYGNAYDVTTERRYDQLRPFALAPFRLLLWIEAGRADLALALLEREEQR